MADTDPITFVDEDPVTEWSPTPTSAANLNDLQRRGRAYTDAQVAFPYVHTNKLAQLVTLTSPVPCIVMTGSFVAKFATALLDMTAVVECLQPFGMHAGVILYYADAADIPAAQLTPRNQFVALDAHVTQLLIGASNGQVGTINGTHVLTGLTPGHTYRYEVVLDLLGYANPIPVNASIRSIATSYKATQFPDASLYLAARTWSDGKCHIIRLDHSQVYRDQYMGSVALPVGGSGQIATLGRVAITPDGSKAVVTNQNNPINSVTVVNTGAALTGDKNPVAPTVQGSYGLPVANSAPSAVAISPDGLTAWICCIGTATPSLIPMTIATGAFGTAINLPGTTAGGPYDIAISADGHYAYIAAGAKVFKVDLTTAPASIATSRVPPEGAAAFCVGLSPGAMAGGAPGLRNAGTILWVGCGTPHRLCKWNVADLSDVRAQGALANKPVSLKALSDGLSVLVVSDVTTDAQVSHRWADDLTEWTEWTNRIGTQPAGYNHAAHEIAVTPAGDIYVTDDTDLAINSWFGGTINVRGPGDSFWEEGLRLRIVGAV